MSKSGILVAATALVVFITVFQAFSSIPLLQPSAQVSGNQAAVPAGADNSAVQASVRPVNTSLSTLGYNSAVSIANNSGTPSRYLYLPSLHPAVAQSNGKFAPAYTGSPAPVGIADYGTAGSYSTTSFSGTISVNRMNPLYLLNDAPTSLGVQLNAVLTGVAVGKNTSNVYWNQNVLYYSARTHQIQFIDNIWNFTSPGAGMTNSTLYANGSGGNLVPGSLYYAIGSVYNVSYPFTVTLYLNSTLNNSRQEVFFNYSISQGLSGGKSLSGSFDHAVFNSSSPVSAPARYRVDGSTTVPIGGIPYDSEFIIGGPGGGSTTTLNGINATMALDYLSGGSYSPVTSAYDAGSATGETANGVAVSWNSTHSVNLTAGPTMVYGMWGTGASGTMQTYRGTISPSESFMFVSKGTAFSNSSASWVPLSPDGSYYFTIPSGNYRAGIFSNWNDPWYGQLSSVPSALTENRSLGIYAPLYAFSNSQLKDLSMMSSGVSSAPYVITGVQNTSIYQVFGKFNDYAFPVFPGVLISGTTAKASFRGMPSFHITYGQATSQAISALTLPPVNYLNFEFYNDTNITLSNSSFISGWFSSTLAGYFPAANLLLWNTTDSLVASNHFSSMDSSVMVYNSNSTASNNTIWGNYFGQDGLVQSGYFSNINTIGAPAGLTLFSSGNLVYNNNFMVYFTALNPNVSIYSGLQTNYSNSWNISREPLSYTMTVNGVPLSGSIMGTGPNAIRYQGGNYWWNYLGNGTSAYNDSGLIQSGGDMAPLIHSVYAVTFNETGLPSGSQWYVLLDNASILVQSSSTSVTFYEPNGTYYAQLYAPGYLANQSAGYILVSGGPQSIGISFEKFYLLTFQESGLPQGTMWSITTGSLSVYSVTDTIQFLATNGTLSYVPGIAGGYHPYSVSGSLLISGSNTTVQVAYAPYLFGVTFTETGLPAGTEWGIFMDGSSVMSTSASLTVQEPNGTHGYTVIGASGYSLSSRYGSVTVDNSSTAEALQFSSSNFSMTFSESGLPAGSTWSVRIGGITHTTSNSTITVEETTGSYNYTVSGPSGFSASVPSGSVALDKNLSVPVSFGRQSAPGIMQIFSYALFAASVAVLLAAFYVYRRR